MKQMNKVKKVSALVMAMAMTMNGIPVCAGEDGSYTVEKTTDGWIKVVNANGKVLGYSENSGVTILEDDNGYAYKDMNKNGVIDDYENWNLDYETRAEDLAAQATIDDLFGVFIVAAPSGFTGTIADSLTDDTKEMLDNGVKGYGIGAGRTDAKTLATWNNRIQEYAESTAFGIPMELTEDTVFTGNGWSGSLGLAASFDPELAAKVAEVQSAESRLTGQSVFMGLQLDLATEPRWCRVKHTLGEDPALVSDLAVAYVNASQSTYDENGNDLGWGKDSVVNQVKHYSGDAAGEGGRESHNEYGKYNVFPGGQFYTHLLPFMSVLELPGLTERADSVMTNYSIAYSETEEYGELVGTSLNSFKLNDILREALGFDGMVCSDWEITGLRKWGIPEDTEAAEVVLRMWEAGGDQLGGEYVEHFYDAYHLGCEKYGEEEFTAKIKKSAARILTTFFKAQLFDNPYIDVDETVEVILGEQNADVKFDQNLKSVVMLKNVGNVIHDTTGEEGEKPTVYIPMVYETPRAKYTSTDPVGTWKLPLDEGLANEYFNVVTDTVSETFTGENDKDGNPTQSVDDIIRASAEEIAGCDYALAIVRSPLQGSGYDSETETYIPISLQYGPYTADSDAVRKVSVAGDTVEVVEETYYGNLASVQKENRSYYGQSTTVTNTSDLDTILYAAENVPEGTPVIVVVDAANAMVFSEFEDKADAILMGFETNKRAYLEIVTGKVEPSALLPIQMPASMEEVEKQFEDVPRDMACHVDSEGNTYDFAFGMNWSGVISDARTEKYDVEPLVGSPLK